MKRRDFFKILGGAALAMIGVRSAQARVCERNVGTLRAIYPIGAIYISTTSTNPADLFGFGTWVRFGNGRTLIGVDEADSANVSGENFGRFNAVQLTGGRKTHTLTTAQMPSHGHGFNNATGLLSRCFTLIPNGVFSGSLQSTAMAALTAVNGGSWHDADFNLANGGFSIHSAGGGGAHNNLPPYITVFMWRRSA